MLVNEIFTSFQGEGTSVGMPCTFLRLSVCNLHCKWCDTWYAWNFGKGDGIEERHGAKTVKMKDESHEQTIKQVGDKLIELKTKNLVITGGEPLLQQKELDELFIYLMAAGKLPEVIEIETNGTVALEPEIVPWITQINCSPKLENSGNDKTARYRPEVLKQYQKITRAFFKFVATNELDLLEIDGIIKECDLLNVILMAEGKTKDEQEQNQQKIAHLARTRGWNFSPRLHILLYDTQRGK